MRFEFGIVSSHAHLELMAYNVDEGIVIASYQIVTIESQMKSVLSLLK